MTSNRIRLGLVCGAIVLVAAAVGARLIQLQVLRHAELSARAMRQHHTEVEVQARRGTIVDRHGCELAISLRAESLYAHPWRIEDPNAVATALAPVLGRSRRELAGELRSSAPFVYLARHLDPDVADAVRALELPIGPDQGLNFQPEPTRRYPRGALARTVIGFAGVDGTGLEGVEYRSDDRLRGDPTIFLAIRDATQHKLLQPIALPERTPNDIVLTLDDVVQHIVERELEHALRTTSAISGAAIVLDPRDGQVLAIAERPLVPRGGRSRLPKSAIRAWTNHYEPGSTFKVVPMALLLEAGKVRADERIDCGGTGQYRFGGRTIRDSSVNDRLTPREIMARSSNIGMVKLTRRLPDRRLYDGIRRFGFGERTGLEVPGEAPGNIAPIGDWSGYTHDSLAFGHDISVTLPQLAAAFAVIANDGVAVAPRLIAGERDARGTPQRAEPAPTHRVLAPAVAAEVRAMLEKVVRDGTGTRAAVPGYRIAGKTGTAEQPVNGKHSAERQIASFAGFAPVESPRIVVVIALDSPAGNDRHGGDAAAPVFARIAADTLLYLRVPRDDDPVIAAAPRVAARRSAE